MSWFENMEHDPGQTGAHLASQRPDLTHFLRKGGETKAVKDVFLIWKWNIMGLFCFPNRALVIQWMYSDGRRWMVSCELLKLLLCWQFFTIRSPGPPGAFPSCSTVDSREGGDILRHIPLRLCSLHPLVLFSFHLWNPRCYDVTKHHSERLQRRAHAVQGLWCTYKPYSQEKALCFAVKSY